MDNKSRSATVRLAVIGSAGIPNRYGGFESFVEHIAPVLSSLGFQVTVTCDRKRYLDDLSPVYCGVRRLFISVPANGAVSPVHDFIAFFRVVFVSDCVLVLGVSAGVFFPIFRFFCWIAGCSLVVNIDGIEWRRSKFGSIKRRFLFLSDWLAQKFSHRIIYDNEGLLDYVRHRHKCVCIAYSGDHAVICGVGLRDGDAVIQCKPYALTICRVEPENNCELLIEGFLRSSLASYIFVGNWTASTYGDSLRRKYAKEDRLRLLDPIYDEREIFRLRNKCACYLHGHSVGGTNPSLVEMLFFDCLIYCWDCVFNRVTAGNGARYFSSADQLAVLLNSRDTLQIGNRASLRNDYSSANIVKKLVAVLR